MTLKKPDWCFRLLSIAKNNYYDFPFQVSACWLGEENINVLISSCSGFSLFILVFQLILKYFLQFFHLR